MDIFGSRWDDHTKKIKDRWCLTDKDTVVLAGDTSWAINFKELEADFEFLKSLKGRKILLKGNHDYWWNSITKMNNFAESFGDIEFLNNNTFETEEFFICGTRGWIIEPGEAHDEKITSREAGRLRLSLETYKKRKSDKEPLVFLHYPPVFCGEENTEIINIMHEYGVNRCYYGHLHGAPAHAAAFEGLYKNINMKLISADFLDFYPHKIMNIL